MTPLLGVILRAMFGLGVAITAANWLQHDAVGVVAGVLMIVGGAGGWGRET